MSVAGGVRSSMIGIRWRGAVSPSPTIRVSFVRPRADQGCPCANDGMFCCAMVGSVRCAVHLRRPGSCLRSITSYRLPTVDQTMCQTFERSASTAIVERLPLLTNTATKFECQDLPEGPEPRQGDCRDQEDDGRTGGLSRPVPCQCRGPCRKAGALCSARGASGVAPSRASPSVARPLHPAGIFGLVSRLSPPYTARRSCGRVVEGTPLLRVQTGNRLEGSNPFGSATCPCESVLPIRLRPGFSWVIREGLSTGPCDRRPGGGLSAPIFSGAHDCASLVDRLRPEVAFLFCD